MPLKLSIVSTLYQSRNYVEEFCARASAVARELVGEDFELVLVNDGSPDDSLDEALACAEKNPHIVIIDLSRNFGHHKSMMTGLAHAQGGLVFLIDSDLEEEPEYLGAFYRDIQNSRADVVYGVQLKRKGSYFERFTGGWFYLLFRLLTGVALPENIVTARLMTRRYVDALLRHQEREVFIAGLWYITGFVQVPHAVTKHGTSETTYTFRRKLSILVNSITSFTNAPLIGIFYFGAAISILAVAYNSFLLLNWALLSHPLSGWTSVMASIWLIGGLVISFIGVVGIYLSKIFSETKQRPYTIVRQIYGRNEG